MKQNITVVLLSVIATLLFVLGVQNLRPSVVQGQSSGGSATVGNIGMATGSMKTGDSVLWLFLPEKQRLLVYELGGNKKLTFRGGRWLDVDVQVQEFLNTKNAAPSRSDVRKALRKDSKKKK